MDTITMIGNTGTYLDSPFHRYKDGNDLAGLVLSSLVDLPALVVRCADMPHCGIPASSVADLPVRGAAVLSTPVGTAISDHPGGSLGIGADPGCEADSPSGFARQGGLGVYFGELFAQLAELPGVALAGEKLLR